VWTDLAQGLSDIGLLFSEQEFAPLLKKFNLNLFSKISRLGWDPAPNEKDLDKLLRSVVLGMLGSSGDRNVINEAKRRFGVFLQDHSTPSPDLASIVFKLAISSGGEEEYNALVQYYENAEQPEMKIKALVCLCSTKSPDLIRRSLDYGLSDKVRSQDVMYVFGSTSSSLVGMNITWEYVKGNWEAIKTHLGGSFLFGRIVSSSAKNFYTEDKAEEVEKFFKQRSVPGIERTIQQTLESIRSNASYLNRETGSLNQWLRENVTD